MSRAKRASLVAPIVLGATRVGLGVLWLHEGVFKYSAHFGRADILLVANSARTNGRVPGYFKALIEGPLNSWPSLFGAVMPLLEVTLGIALTIGVLSRPAALGSLLTLMTYWSSDQLIAQYPIMGILSAVVLAWPMAAVRFSTTSLVVEVLRRKHQAAALLSGPARGWL